MMTVIKTDSEGNFNKIKSRYNANPKTIKCKLKGSDNASPTVTVETINAIMHLYVTRGPEAVLRSYDITGAFLHALLQSGVIDKNLTPTVLEMRPDLKVGLLNNGTLLVSIQRAIYGLEESAKLFNEMLSEKIRSIGYKSTPEDPCNFVKEDERGGKSEINASGIHVDDILSYFPNEENAKEFEDMLLKEFGIVSKHDIKDGPINFTGRTITLQEDGNIKVTMNKIIEKLIENHHGEGIERYPCDENIFKNKKGEEWQVEIDPAPFLSQVMALMYLARNMRFDVMLPTAYLCTKVKNPTREDGFKLFKVIDYLKRTKEDGLIFKKESTDELTIYVDCAYKCHNDLKGHTGIIMKLGVNTIGIRCHKHRDGSRSSCEAEIYGITEAVDATSWIRNMFRRMGIKTTTRIKIYEDNKSAIILAMRGWSNKNKHLVQKYQAIHEAIERGDIELIYQPTSDHMADVMTKGIRGPLFTKYVERIMRGKT